MPLFLPFLQYKENTIRIKYILFVPLFSLVGHWIFCNRRWLSPADPVDKEELEINYEKLCKTFAEFRECPWEHFLLHLSEVVRRTHLMISGSSYPQAKPSPFHAPTVTGLFPDTSRHPDQQTARNQQASGARCAPLRCSSLDPDSAAFPSPPRLAAPAPAPDDGRSAFAPVTSRRGQPDRMDLGRLLNPAPAQGQGAAVRAWGAVEQNGNGCRPGGPVDAVCLPTPRNLKEPDGGGGGGGGGGEHAKNAEPRVGAAPGRREGSDVGGAVGRLKGPLSAEERVPSALVGAGADAGAGNGPRGPGAGREEARRVREWLEWRWLSRYGGVPAAAGRDRVEVTARSISLDFAWLRISPPAPLAADSGQPRRSWAP